MKRKVLKNLIVIICFISVISLFSGCANGCNNDTPSVKYEDREVGDFVVRFYEDYCEIKGTTEQGNNQRFLVIPEFIDGVRVESVGFKGFVFESHGLKQPDIKSDKLERVYFETTAKVHPNSFDHYANCCPNIKKVFYPGLEDVLYLMSRSGYTVYYPHSVNEKDWLHSETQWANLSYYYNYENPGNDDYYWIDDFDYGGTIKFTPKDPVRDGYEFGGWYKEAECINIWDFETDVLPEEKTERIYYESGEFWDKTVYQETILYAKWI